MKENKINSWKIATILLSLIAIFLLINILYPQSPINFYNKPIDLKTFQIDKNNFNSLYNFMNSGNYYQICSIANEKCTIMKKP